MIAVDTNVLVYAHREDSAWHEPARIAGPQLHDARVAALCLHHGVQTLWSADRDFGRFPELEVRNPLLADTRARTCIKPPDG